MTAQPRRIEVELLQAGSVVIRRLQLRAMQALTSATPVETGFARAGWTPTVGSPARSLRSGGRFAQLDRPKDLEVAKTVAAQRRAANAAASQSIANTYRIEQGRMFISNPVRYIVFLNNGSSAQAPARFVERAVVRAIRSLASSRIPTK